MAFTRKSDFTFKHVDQADEPVYADTTTLKTNLDSQAKELRDFINDDLLDELEAITAAANIGCDGIYPNLQSFINAIISAGSGSIPPDATISIAKFVVGLFSTDGTMADNSDTKISSQKAVKTYADTKIPSTYLDTDVTLTSNSDTKIASQRATKTYANTKIEKAIFNAIGQLLYSTGSSSYAVLNKSTAYQGLRMNSAENAPEWGNVMIGGVQVFTASGTFTAPKTGTYKVIVTGGGGSGARASDSKGGAGSAGGTAIKWVSLTKNDAVTVTVGDGGTYPVSDANGNAGSSSSFGAYCSATGGGAGNTSGSGGASDVGGLGSNGDINIRGGGGQSGYTSTTAIYPTGGASYWGGGSANSGVSSAGAFGSGGCGNNANGGNGNKGIVTIEW